jgi:hypothetical protein
MPITEEMKTAWKTCNFCSKPTNEIAEIIRNPSRWKELPLGYKCAWRRISQVGFGRFGKLPLWSNLCQERAYCNNSPSYNWAPSDWLETWCDTYRAIVDQAKRK